MPEFLLLCPEQGPSEGHADHVKGYSPPPGWEKISGSKTLSKEDFINLQLALPLPSKAPRLALGLKQELSKLTSLKLQPWLR